LILSITDADISRVLDGVPKQAVDQRPADLDDRHPEVENPATGEPLCTVADATPEQGLEALDAAVAVQDDWSATDPRVRGEILRKSVRAVGRA
jgi:succinate-semialdehyde dehydrogenase/glutarate-semialdehyde dehydrogenase